MKVKALECKGFYFSDLKSGDCFRFPNNPDILMVTNERSFVSLENGRVETCWDNEVIFPVRGTFVEEI